MSISKGNSRAYAAALAKGSARERALQNSGRTHSLGGGETTVKRSYFGPPEADALSQTNNVLATGQFRAPAQVQSRNVLIPLMMHLRASRLFAWMRLVHPPKIYCSDRTCPLACYLGGDQGRPSSVELPMRGPRKRDQCVGQ